jgi:hypothetical protein
MRRLGHVGHMGESRNASKVLVGEPDRKRPLGRYWWVNNINVDLKVL